MDERIEIIDVAPRDGLQNEPKLASTADKILLIKKLVAAGVASIQTTSFVNPKRVPQMADADQLAASLDRSSGVNFSALVLNFHGYERAVKAGFRNLDVGLAASETFLRKNANQSIADSLKFLDLVSQSAKRDGVSFRVGIAVSFHCPFEGPTHPKTVARLAHEAHQRGASRIGLSDTDGRAFPNQITAALSAVRDEAGLKLETLVLHLHDTHGRALANVLAGIQSGVRAYDGAVGGLGGCPFCPGASGNVATEDLVTFVEGLGFRTGVNMEKLVEAAQFARSLSSRPYEGHHLRTC
jgi:hydroxymethylglutaryl-CoA lyase